MKAKGEFTNHYENSVLIPADPQSIFTYADHHTNFSSHMNNSSWMMGGGKMKTHVDERKGQKLGSHIKMSGKVFGINLFLDEVITRHEPPFYKEWQTVGKVNLLVIDNYILGFEIKPDNGGSLLRVYIDYDLPKSAKTYWLGILFGRMYARECVRQMINGTLNHFAKQS